LNKSFFFSVEIKEREKLLVTTSYSEELFQYVWDNARDIIFTLDRNGLITSINKEFENSIGWKRKEWIGKHFLDIVHPEDNQEVIDGFEATIRGEKPPPYAARILSKSGQIKIFEAKGTPQIVNGEIIGYLGIARDITDRKKVEDVMRASEKQYRALINSIEDPIHLVNNRTEIILANPAFSKWLKFLNLNPNLKGKTVLEAFPFLTEKIEEEYFHVFKKGEVLVTHESTPIHNQYYYTETKKIPIFDEDQENIKQVLTIIRDITESKELEEQLRKNEERLRSFMDAATDSFSLWDSSLRLLDVNETGLTNFYPHGIKESIIGSHIEEFHPNPEDIKVYREVLKTGKPFIADRIAPPDIYGNKIVSQKAFKVGDGLGIITSDITDRKRMEDELKESEEKFRSIFENAPIGMALVDFSFKFSKINNTFCEMLGYSPKELVKLKFSEITHPDYVERDIKYTQKLTNDKIPIYETEKQYIKKDGAPIWARTTVSILKGDEDQPKHFVAMIEDISALKQREEEIRKQLLKFKILDGRVYLIKEEIPRLSQTAFQDLLKVGYKGYIASRTLERDFNLHFDERVNFFHLSEKNNVTELLEFLKILPQKSVLLIDRLEYLFVNDGFQNAMRFIYKLQDQTYLLNLVVLISLDSTTLSEKELKILEKETHQLEPRFIARISEELLEILRLVFQQNNLGLQPKYSEVGEMLRISRPTARKRIKNLVTRGYLLEHEKGKSKFLELSGKGELLFIT
jgi:PAS domain S-box-containing protein